ncbi:hypothetical protein [Campylobacter sp. MG1]|uniref:hypothetical protein n=1 Tax=Campylobacter sp. MG1 TaxID=2976332 RepID=UPI00226D22DD|nr:hypothetical protein [Campylobacter sp. MG1]
MLIKSFNIVLLALVSMLFFVVIQKPYEINSVDYKIDFKSLEADDIVGYEIDKKLLKKSYAKHYFRQGEQDNLLEFTLSDLTKSISSDKVVKDNENIVFENNVNYKDDKITLKTKILNYSIKDKILSSNTLSDVFYNFHSLKAKSFIYNTINGDLTLKEVNLCIEK